MKKILILGGSSDIGVSLSKKLLLNKKNNIYLHSNETKIEKSLLNKVKNIKVNIKNINQNNIKKKFDNDYDIIVNLIGYTSNQSFIDFKIKELQKTIYINSIIPLLIIKQSLNHMIKNKFGRIVNTSSVGVKFGGGSNTFGYSLSKHINEFMPNYIRTLSSNNIFYNVLRIGVTNTKIHKKILNKSLKKRAQLIPSKKIATTEDISNYLYFLINDNNFITNEVINITGGE